MSSHIDGVEGFPHARGAYYEVVIRGRIGGALVRWFDDVEVRSSGPDATYLQGWFADQAALQSFLSGLGDLGLELSSIRRLPDAE